MVGPCIAHMQFGRNNKSAPVNVYVSAHLSVSVVTECAEASRMSSPPGLFLMATGTTLSCLHRA